MKKRQFFIIVIIALFSTTIIYLLQINYLNKLYKKNGFKRQIRPDYLSMVRALKMDRDFNYICGLSKTTIYLANYSYPSHLFLSDYSFTDTESFNIIFPESYKIAYKSINVQLDSPDVYFMEGITPAIVQASYPGFRLKSYYTLNGLHFDKAMVALNSSIITTFYDYTNDEKKLIRKKIGPDRANDLRADSIFKINKQIEGRFSTDGAILYSPRLGYIVYVYYYRNQFVCLDSDFKLLYVAKTIDTFNLAKISVDTIRSEKIVTFSAPPLVINRKSCISKETLLINSSLIADNETKHDFEKNDAVDSYDLNSGKYQYSFYIPKFGGHKIDGFKLMGDTLVAITGSYLCIYKINRN